MSSAERKYYNICKMENYVIYSCKCKQKKTIILDLRLIKLIYLKRIFLSQFGMWGINRRETIDFGF